MMKRHEMFSRPRFEINWEMYNQYPIQSSSWKYDWRDIRGFLPEHGKQDREWRSAL